ncbi:hypothetical protein F5890DRAFT_1548451, partial [Lentinula detonsa]
MILLAALPRAWDGLAMSILSQYDGDSLTLDDITGIIQNEYSRRLAIQKADSSLAAMITGIEHFGDHDPQWQSQKKQKGGAPKPWQQTPGASGDQEKKKKPTRRGKKGGKGKGKPNAQESVQMSEPSVAQFSSSYVINIPQLVASTSTITLDDQDNSDPILANMKQEEEEIKSSWSDEMDEYEITGEGDERLMY